LSPYGEIIPAIKQQSILTQIVKKSIDNDPMKASNPTSHGPCPDFLPEIIMYCSSNLLN
jgi:hypothetical protein